MLDGGRLASFGSESLRRGVTLRANEQGTAGRLIRPTQPSAQDPFGTRFEDVRRTSTPVALELIGGEPDYGLLEGLGGPLTGLQHARGERSSGRRPRDDPCRARRRDRAEDDESTIRRSCPPRPGPRSSRREIGKGLFIRVGLPGWSSRLDDRQVSQVTRNIADLLRNLEPKIRSAP